MKNYKELTVEELASLTEEEITKIKKYILAEAGIKLTGLPEEPQAPEFNFTTVYTVDNSYYFSDINEAQKVVELINNCKSLITIRYAFDKSYFIKGLVDYSGCIRKANVSSIEALSQSEYNNKVIVLKEFNKKLEEFKKEKEEFIKNQNAADEALEDFETMIEKAIYTMNRRKDLYSLFVNQYVPIAEGNRDIAMKFLKKAYYDISEEDEEYILNHKQEEDGVQ